MSHPQHVPKHEDHDKAGTHEGQHVHQRAAREPAETADAVAAGAAIAHAHAHPDQQPRRHQPCGANIDSRRWHGCEQAPHPRRAEQAQDEEQAVDVWRQALTCQQGAQRTGHDACNAGDTPVGQQVDGSSQANHQATGQRCPWREVCKVDVHEVSMVSRRDTVLASCDVIGSVPGMPSSRR
jgi:hypothetical protein